MHFAIAPPLIALSWLVASQLVQAEDHHGEGSEGTVMGPVAFMWPEDRKWDAVYDNTGPCGSPAGVSERTIFPLTQGSVALTVADDAFSVSFFISFSENPLQQSDFQEQVVKTITEVDPGHQCYKMEALPPFVTAGTNATIQLQYTSTYEGENNGQSEPFFACADITFVETTDFSIQVPCFNVTSDDFEPPAATASPSPSAALSSSGDGLTGGAKAGIAVGTIVGSLAVVGLVAFLLLRKRKSGSGEFEMTPRSKAADEADSARSR